MADADGATEFADLARLDKALDQLSENKVCTNISTDLHTE